MSVVWGWPAMAPTPASWYLRALHAVAEQYMPRPHQLSATLHRLRRTPPTPPWTAAYLSAFLDEAQAVADERLARQRAAKLRSTSVNGFTRTSVHLPCARLEPYPNIQLRPQLQLAGRQQRLEEITAQAHYKTQDALISVDPDLYQQPSPWRAVDFALGYSGPRPGSRRPFLLWCVVATTSAYMALASSPVPALRAQCHANL